MSEASLSEHHRRLIAAGLRGEAAQALRPGRPPSSDPSAATPLALEQEALWVNARRSPDSVMYNEVAAFCKTGPLDLDALRDAFNRLVARHDIWHTVFRITNGTPVQVVMPPPRYDLPLLDLSGFTGDERRDALTSAIAGMASRLYDLENGPLIRPRLVKLAPDSHRLYLCLHYLIFDGVSLYRTVLPELVALYDAIVAGKNDGLVSPSVQYADYVRWQRSAEGTATIRRRADYWSEHLAGAPPLELPLVRPRPKTQRFRGATLPVDVPRELVDRLRDVGRRHNCTLFGVLATAFALLLHRYTGQNDLVFATLTDLRSRAEFEDLVGYCTTPIAVRMRITPETPIDLLLAAMRSELIDAAGHAVPFASLVPHLDSQAGPGIVPFLPACLVLEPPQRPGDGTWTVQSVDASITDRLGKCNVDLYLEFEERTSGKLAGRVTVNTDIFDREFASRFSSNFGMILREIASSAPRLVSECLSPLHGAGDSSVEDRVLPTEIRQQRPGWHIDSVEAVPRAASPLERELAALWSRRLGLERVDLDADFFDLGGYSLLAVQLVRDIEARLDRPVPVTWLVEGGGSVTGMARLVAGGPSVTHGETASSALAIIWAREANVPAVRHLRKRLGPATVLTSVVPDFSKPDADNVEQMVEQMLPRAISEQGDGPYALAGFSIGGLIAYQMAGRLAASGAEVAWLGVLDAPTPRRARAGRRFPSRVARRFDRGRGIGVSPPELSASPGTGRVSAPESSRPLSEEEQLRRIAESYRLRAHSIPLDLFATTASVRYFRSPTLGWDQLHRGPLHVHPAGRSHATMFTGPEVDELGRTIGARLSDVKGVTPR